jgi:diacylglycerol kinase family enzyme
MRVCLLHHPDAGYQRYDRDELAGKLRDAGHTVLCPNAPAGPDLVVQGDRPPDVVLVAGGDGSVRQAAERLAGGSVPLSVLPLGTANNVATSLGLAGDVDTLISQLSNMTPVRLDLGRVEGPWGASAFLEGAGFGPFARAAVLLSHPAQQADFAHEEAELHRDRTVLEEMIWNYAARDCRLTLDDDEVSGTFVCVQLLNLPMIGPNLLVAPDADPRDGLLDVLLVTEEDRQAFASLASNENARTTETRPLTVRRAHRVRLLWDGAEFHVDDQLYEAAAPGELKAWLDRQAVTFLVPPGPADRLRQGYGVVPRPLPSA